MYRLYHGVPVGALALCSSALVQAARPQFRLVDLGPTTVAGSGLPWQTVNSLLRRISRRRHLLKVALAMVLL